MKQGARFGHGGMLQQRAFDGFGQDFESAAHDRAIGSPSQEKETVFVVTKEHDLQRLGQAMLGIVGHYWDKEQGRMV